MFKSSTTSSSSSSTNMEVIKSLKSLNTVRNLAVVAVFFFALFLVTFLAPTDVVFSCYSQPPPTPAVEPEGNNLDAVVSRKVESPKLAVEPKGDNLDAGVVANARAVESPEPALEAEPKEDELEAVLRRAAGPPERRKPVIVLVLNNAYVEGSGFGVNMLDVFLESLWVGDGTRPLIDNLLVAATDPAAYERCLFKRLHCYLLTSKIDESNLVGEKVYMSKGYINMTWTKVLFCLTVLQKGYDYVFTDVDIMWLRNPFEILDAAKTDDIQFSTDQFYGDSRSTTNQINSGFFYVKSNKKTISLFQKWYDMRSDLKKSNQPVLREIIAGGAMEEFKISGSFLDTRLFSGFCQESEDLDKVVTVHANCCRYISAKVKDLIVVLEDWKKFKGSPKNKASRPTWSKHANCLKSWE